MNVLEQGPWFTGKHYLIVHKWEPEFQVAKAIVSSLAALDSKRDGRHPPTLP